MNRYQDITVLRTDTGKPYYKTTLYPQVPLSVNDIYVITGDGDRFDILAQQYYGDPTLYWVISIANTAVAGTDLPTDLPQNSLIIPEGTQIRIPANYANIIRSFNVINT